MNAGLKSYVTKMRKAVSLNAPKEKECPKCERKRSFKFFGVRTHRDPKTGKPNRFSPQSYCVDCRSGKPATSKPKASKPEPKKAKAAAKVITPAKPAKKEIKVVAPKKVRITLFEAAKKMPYSVLVSPTPVTAAPAPAVVPEVVAPPPPAVVAPPAPAAPAPAAPVALRPNGKPRRMAIVDMVPEKKEIDF
jgi:hypothetical protein